MKNISNGILIVAGNCIGAGMLGMPVVCGISGFIPSTIIMIIVLLYMNIISKIILKANFLFKADNIVILAEKQLGIFGKTITAILFILLFQSLLIAYISKSGELVQGIIKNITKIEYDIKYYYIIITSITIIITSNRDHIIYQTNKILMTSFVVIFFILIFYLSKNISFLNLTYVNLKTTPYIFPILITAFGFHNIIPSIKNYYNDYNQIKTIINLGMLLTLIIYTIWNAIILSTIYTNTSITYNENKIITEAIIENIGINNSYIIINVFSFIAIITSILGIGISIKEFFTSIFTFKRTIIKNLIHNIVTFIPPLFIININPKLFFLALDIAGGLFAVMLFGLIPNLIFIKHYKENKEQYNLLKTKILITITIFILITFISTQIYKYTQ
ncbi:MAG TPA: aromatic amino acid transport family protein [Candidatus Azoamicus sp. OHIO1]